MKKALKTKRKLRIFAFYELIISAIVILSAFTYFFKVSDFYSPIDYVPTFIVGVLGLFAGILLLKKKKSGMYLSMAWAFLQMFKVYLHGISVDFTQILTLHLVLDLRPEFDYIFSFNFLGALFLILLIIWRKELD